MTPQERVSNMAGFAESCLADFRSPGSSVVSAVQLQAVNRVRADVAVLLPLPRPHGVLVHGGVGLSRGVVARGQAVAGLAAVVAVPVVHGAVLVIQSYSEETFNKLMCHWKHLLKGFSRFVVQVRAVLAALFRGWGKGHTLVFRLKSIKMHLCACSCTHSSTTTNKLTSIKKY